MYVLTRSVFFTSLGVFFVALLLILMHQTHEDQWQMRMHQQLAVSDSLRAEVAARDSLLVLWQEEDSTRIKSVYNNYYDAFDEKGYRIYGLYKTPENKTSLVKLARKFNIENPNSIKKSTALGQDWYVVPVKGVHYLKKGETPLQVARLYYHNPKDVDILKAFNPKWEAGRNILIPFN